MFCTFYYHGDNHICVRTCVWWTRVCLGASSAAISPAHILKQFSEETTTTKGETPTIVFFFCRFAPFPLFFSSFSFSIRFVSFSGCSQTPSSPPFCLLPLPPFHTRQPLSQHPSATCRWTEEKKDKESWWELNLGLFCAYLMHFLHKKSTEVTIMQGIFTHGCRKCFNNTSCNHLSVFIMCCGWSEQLACDDERRSSQTGNNAENMDQQYIRLRQGLLKAQNVIDRSSTRGGNHKNPQGLISEIAQAETQRGIWQNWCGY